MTNYVYIAASLDGYIADVDGGIDWLYEFPDPENTDYGYAAFMAGIDAIVMGRHSFEKVLTFDSWPYEKPVFVLSNRLTAPPNHLSAHVELLRGEVDHIVEKLHRLGYQDLYIDGGETITRFLQADLIDELIITRIPILLGNGIPLFGKFDRKLRFIHNQSEIFSNSLVQGSYSRER